MAQNKLKQKVEGLTKIVKGLLQEVYHKAYQYRGIYTFCKCLYRKRYACDHLSLFVYTKVAGACFSDRAKRGTQKALLPLEGG